MNKERWKNMRTSVCYVLIGILIASTFNMVTGSFNIGEYDYQLSYIPDGIDCWITYLEPDSSAPMPVNHYVNLTYNIDISQNLKQMAANCDVVVKGSFFDLKENKCLMPVEYTHGVTRIPLARVTQFNISEVLKGELNCDENNFASICLKEYERIIVDTSFGEYADVKDPLFVEPMLNTEYILFLNLNKYSSGGNFYSLSEPLLINVSGNEAKLEYNLEGYYGYFEAEAKFALEDENQIRDIIKVQYFGTKINFKDDITGKTTEEIRKAVR